MSARATISDSKSEFHKEFPYVIPAIYRKLADELLVELHLLSHQTTFKTTPVFALGLKELFTKFTSGYKPSHHINSLFNAICNCNGFEPSEINSLAEEIINEVNSSTKINLIDYLSRIKENNKSNNYYSRISAIGIYRIVHEHPELKGLSSKDFDIEIAKIAETLSYSNTRVEKDITQYKSNIDKMNQALEIIAQNLSSKEKK